MYPEHEKLKAVKDMTQFVHDFLEFCEEKGVSLVRDGEIPVSRQRFDDLLFEFIEVDPKELEHEKRLMLRNLRDSSQKKKAAGGQTRGLLRKEE